MARFGDWHPKAASTQLRFVKCARQWLNFFRILCHGVKDDSERAGIIFPPSYRFARGEESNEIGIARAHRQRCCVLSRWKMALSPTRITVFCCLSALFRYVALLCLMMSPAAPPSFITMTNNQEASLLPTQCIQTHSVDHIYVLRWFIPCLPLQESFRHEVCSG